jgi:hypothetical protein
MAIMNFISLIVLFLLPRRAMVHVEEIAVPPLKQSWEIAEMRTDRIVWSNRCV